MKTLQKFIEYLDSTDMTFEEKAKTIAIFSDKECRHYVGKYGEYTPEIAYAMIRYGYSINPKTILRKDPKQTVLDQKHWNRAVNDDPYIYHGMPRPYRSCDLGKLHVIHKLNHMGPKAYSNKDDFLKKFRKSQLRALIAHTEEKERENVINKLRCDTDLRMREINTITYEDCFNAVDMDPLQIQFVPETIIDKCLCIMAVYREDSNAFNYIPSKFVSKAMVTHAIKNDETIDYTKINEKYMTDEIYYLLLRYNRIVLSHVPEEKRTPIMCMLAVYCNEYNRNFVPENILNDEKYKQVFDSFME